MPTSKLISFALPPIAVTMLAQLIPMFGSNGSMLSGSQPMQGDSVSYTVTSNEHSEGLPYKSTTVHVTVVEPSSNIWPSRVMFEPVIVLVAPLIEYVIEAIPELSLAVMSQSEP